MATSPSSLSNKIESTTRAPKDRATDDERFSSSLLSYSRRILSRTASSRFVSSSFRARASAVGAVSTSFARRRSFSPIRAFILFFSLFISLECVYHAHAKRKREEDDSTPRARSLRARACARVSLSPRFFWEEKRGKQSETKENIPTTMMM